MTTESKSVRKNKQQQRKRKKKKWFLYIFIGKFFPLFFFPFSSVYAFADVDVVILTFICSKDDKVDVDVRMKFTKNESTKKRNLYENAESTRKTKFTKFFSFPSLFLRVPKRCIILVFQKSKLKALGNKQKSKSKGGTVWERIYMKKMKVFLCRKCVRYQSSFYFYRVLLRTTEGESEISEHSQNRHLRMLNKRRSFVYFYIVYEYYIFHDEPNCEIFLELFTFSCMFFVLFWCCLSKSVNEIH